MTIGNLDIRPLEELQKRTDDRRWWEESVQRVGDVHYQIPYLEAAACAGDGGVLMIAIFRHPKGSVLYPFTLRSLAPLGFSGAVNGARFDMTTPYEYGGPVVNVANSSDQHAVVEDFQEAFVRYCRTSGIVSEFVRFHPLLKNHEMESEFYVLRKSCDNVVVDLNQDEDEIFKGFSSSTRRNIRLAEKRGVRVEKAKLPSASMSEFVELYKLRIDRLGARDYYYFSEQYFDQLAEIPEELISLYFSRNTVKKSK